MTAPKSVHTINIQCTSSLHLRIKCCADFDGRPLSTYIRRLIETHCIDKGVTLDVALGTLSKQDYIAKSIELGLAGGPREAEDQWLKLQAKHVKE